MIWYALATVRRDSALVPALVIEQQLFELAAVWESLNPDKPAPDWIRRDVGAMLADWSNVAAPLERLASAVAESLPRLSGVRLGLETLAAPFVPARVFCAAANYAGEEDIEAALAAKADSKPNIFLKTASSVIGPEETVRIPPETTMPDWEVELAAVIGQRARRVTPDRALDYVAGYTIVNDISARDLNMRNDSPFKVDWLQGKNHDTFCPIGPWIVPSRFIEDPQRVGLKLTLNGELMQNSTTAGMIWTLREQIAYLSTIVTLLPGDVIATGTPAGIGVERGLFLTPGDVMVASIDHIGELRNPVAAEAAI